MIRQIGNLGYEAAAQYPFYQQEERYKATSVTEIDSCKQIKALPNAPSALPWSDDSPCLGSVDYFVIIVIRPLALELICL